MKILDRVEGRYESLLFKPTLFSSKYAGRSQSRYKNPTSKRFNEDPHKYSP